MTNIPLNKPTGHQTLPGPYAFASAIIDSRLNPATARLVDTQVNALLESSGAYSALSREKRDQIASDMNKIAGYVAALVHDEWHQSKRLGQEPILRKQTFIEPTARAAAGPPTPPPQPPPVAERFAPRAASQVGRVTQQTLNAIAFPTFVADLIKGTFQAIVDASIQQMEAYGALLANVAKTVDQFMADNITDNQARDYLSQSYPGHFRVEADDREGPQVVLRDGWDERETPTFEGMGLPDDFELDEDSVEEVMVPAARRQLARQRHQLLSTMVLMGINRIVVTSGHIKASMGFRIDAKDRATAERATNFDFKNETTAGTGMLSSFLGFNAKTKNTVAYVSSTKKESEDELNVEADLTGEVDLKFKSDYFPLERFADSQAITLIQGNTPNPAGNRPAQNENQDAAVEAPRT